MIDGQVILLYLSNILRVLRGVFTYTLHIISEILSLAEN